MAMSEEAGPPGVPVSFLKAAALGKLPLGAVHPLDLDFPGLRVVHLDPPVFVVEGFLTPKECDDIVQLSEDPLNGYEVGSPTFSSQLSASASRTSTSWFLRYEAVPTLVERVSALLKGVDQTCFEEPQLVRYEPGQQFKWHLDGVPKAQLENGGQRLATTLVYLNDLEDELVGAGATTFRELGLKVVPRKGMALLFFPAFAAAGTIGPDGLEEGTAHDETGAAAVAGKNCGGGAEEVSSPPRVPEVKGPKASSKKTKKNKKKGVEPVIPLSFEAGEGDERTLHAGAPPIFGTKWIAQIWTHEASYGPADLWG